MALENTLRVAVASDLHAYEDNDVASNSTVPSHLSLSLPEKFPGQHPIAGLEQLFATPPGLHSDMLLCPGDLGDKAKPSATKYAWEQLHRIGKALSVQIVVSATGNHDLDSRYKYTDFDARGTLIGLVPPFPCASEEDNDRYWSRNYMVIDSDPRYRLVVLNSAAYHGTEPSEIDHGRVADSTLSRLKADLAASAPRPINILLCHHHPQRNEELNVPDYEAMTGGQKLLDLLDAGDYGSWMVIHGHKHFPQLSYARGGLGSPVVLSAGSLCANLYSTLQTRVRNQFHLVTFNLDDVCRIGLVGTIESWDWVYGEGWQDASSKYSGLPHMCAFGSRTSLKILAARISKLLPDNTKRSWVTIAQADPEIAYLIPKDFRSLRSLLQSNYKIAIIENNGQPVEIGRMSQ